MSKRILICISGGGAIQLESAAGILSVLDESGELDGAEIDYLACSGGAPVAALHASGMSGDKICQAIRDTPMEELMRFPLFARYMDVSGIRRFLEEHMPSFPLPNCRVAVTRLRDMKSCLADATPITVIASMSIPGIFRPQKINGEEYTDGGVKNIIPTCSMQELSNYERVCLLLAPEGEMLSSFFLEDELRSLAAVFDREITQIYESGYDKMDNVVIFRPDLPEEAKESSLLSNLIDWSPGFCMMDHAVAYAKERLKQN